MLKHTSILTQITGFMVLLTVFAVIGMGLTNQITESVQGNAHAINKSGTLRMQSYRFLSEIPLAGHSQQYLNDFESDLTLLSGMKAVSPAKIQQQFLAIEQTWRQKLRPALEAAKQPEEARAPVAAFVGQIDSLVSAIDHQTESTIRLVAAIQLVFIALMILLLLLSARHFRRRILHPWQRLLAQADAMGQGNFQPRFADYDHRDEITMIGNTLNRTAEELSALYGELESRVAAKTQDLQEKNQMLAFLYKSGQRLNNTKDLTTQLTDILRDLHQIVPEGALCLRIFEDNNASRFTEIGNCGRGPSQAQEQLSWNLSGPINRYGVLTLLLPAGKQINSEQQNMMQMLSKQIISAFALAYQHEQQQQLILMDERSVIARELHDSIAQSLSCLKIQISYLQMHSAQIPENCQTLLTEMRREVNGAYHQLRELLTTFRLKLTEPGLFAALQSTLDEFEQRLGYRIGFDFQLSGRLVSAHQTIHVVQIVREALSNILQHANASEARVVCRSEDQMIYICVEDNGEGIPEHPEKNNHYGLSIMRERAATLHGTCRITSREQGGTLVLISFPANTTIKINEDDSGAR
ncbi:nitrate/nitrite two-component system sensor histidine kinase NarX [Morganella morganii]|uniref:nitrate/nitrite two-component system sensor histidine kinase NarX n=1 Tax=Morganella morganii TaxID=582 RepID=UPI0021A296E8|nr:nitrate/nitrite two-component system sensor histidine kinase NarX [Morganella morganii]